VTAENCNYTEQNGLKESSSQ